MRAKQTSGSLRRKGLSRRRSKWRRNLVEVACLFSVFAIIVYISSTYMNGIPGSHSGSRQAGAGQDAEQKHRVGAILLPPEKGSNCEERSFDNATGHIVSVGTVDCEKALSSAEKHAPEARLRSITAAFKK